MAKQPNVNVTGPSTASVACFSTPGIIGGVPANDRSDELLPTLIPDRAVDNRVRLVEILAQNLEEAALRCQLHGLAYFAAGVCLDLNGVCVSAVP